MPSSAWSWRSPTAPWSARRILDQALRDLDVALEQDDGQKLGGKSAEASRFISARWYD